MPDRCGTVAHAITRCIESGSVTETNRSAARPRRNSTGVGLGGPGQRRMRPVRSSTPATARSAVSRKVAEASS
ncbi:hypothetical protein ACFPM0_35155 [Pseudonocardia sulfidoxydans]|uniref:hypothetical protein n=1 Tax=Pseudonocardia sulfidoxydans TaxID=54011 RepID=UPI00361D545A